MKVKAVLSLIFFFLTYLSVAQDHQIQTLIGKGSSRASGGYGAISNKFTTIDGHYANLAEIYGGWYINHRLLLGVGIAAVTNDIPVAPEFRAMPHRPLSYEYGQVGMMTEYVIASDKAIHLAFQLFGGAGFTIQYERYTSHDRFDDYYPDDVHDENWFFVAEPGVKLELNLFRWMRFSPGVSYRAAFNSDGLGLSDDALSAISYNATLKFGKF